MSERCANCGTELFAGQQFCRRCGAVVRQAGDERPTQILEGGGAEAVAQGGAAFRRRGDRPLHRARPLHVVKRPAGRHAIGRLGDGDSPLLIKVVNGDIKLKNQP